MKPQVYFQCFGDKRCGISFPEGSFSSACCLSVSRGQCLAVLLRQRVASLVSLASPHSALPRMLSDVLGATQESRNISPLRDPNSLTSAKPPLPARKALTGHRGRVGTSLGCNNRSQNQTCVSSFIQQYLGVIVLVIVESLQASLAM